MSITIDKSGRYFDLVIAASKRAKDLNDGATRSENLEPGCVTNALAAVTEIENGLISLESILTAKPVTEDKDDDEQLESSTTEALKSQQSVDENVKLDEILEDI